MGFRLNGGGASGCGKGAGFASIAGFSLWLVKRAADQGKG